MPHGRPWSKEKKERFARDWNDGMDIWLLKEKYATSNPSKMATNMRNAGMQLTTRNGKGDRRK
jgi:hypothetical protein